MALLMSIWPLQASAKTTQCSEIPGRKTIRWQAQGAW
jgi:hypothetical protein